MAIRRLVVMVTVSLVGFATMPRVMFVVNAASGWLVNRMRSDQNAILQSSTSSKIAGAQSGSYADTDISPKS